jgi:hypothetical protein
MITKKRILKAITAAKESAVERMKDMIREIAQTQGTNPQGALRDMLTDLRHIAQQENLDFDFAVQGSAEVYEEEQEAEGDV